MLFMHEVHKVRGRAEDDFEAAFRNGWMPMLAEGNEARLLWYTNQAHGSGPAYTVITVTAVRDGAAWERLTHRVQKGDLREWMRGLHGRWFKLPDATFDAIHYGGMAAYKIGIMLFNLAPLLALWLLRQR